MKINGDSLKWHVRTGSESYGSQRATDLIEIHSISIINIDYTIITYRNGKCEWGYHISDDDERDYECTSIEEGKQKIVEDVESRLKEIVDSMTNHGMKLSLHDLVTFEEVRVPRFTVGVGMKFIYPDSGDTHAIIGTDTKLYSQTEWDVILIVMNINLKESYEIPIRSMWSLLEFENIVIITD